MKASAEHALSLLRAAGASGVTSGEAANAYLLSMSQRCGELRRMGYEIKSERVPDSAQHRFTLLSEPA